MRTVAFHRRTLAHMGQFQNCILGVLARSQHVVEKSKQSIVKCLNGTKTRMGVCIKMQSYLALAASANNSLRVSFAAFANKRFRFLFSFLICSRILRRRSINSVCTRRSSCRRALDASCDAVALRFIQ